MDKAALAMLENCQQTSLPYLPGEMAQSIDERNIFLSYNLALHWFIEWEYDDSMSDAPQPLEHIVLGFPASTTWPVGARIASVAHSLLAFFPFSLAKPEIT